MKNKPLYKPKDILPHFKEILRVLLPGPANINYIFRYIKQTGLPGSGYKRKILDAINYLEETDFIVDVSGYKGDRRGKKQIKQLTVLGRELAELLDSIDQYYTLYSELSKKVHSELNHIHKLESTKLLNSVSPVYLFSIIVLRYVSIMSYAYHDLRKNADVKKDILNGIIMMSISKHLSFSVDDLKDDIVIYTNKDHIEPDDIELVTNNKSIMDKFIGIPIRRELMDIVRQVSDKDLLHNIDILLSILSISSIELTNEQINYHRELLNLHQQGKISMSDPVAEQRLLTLFEQYNKNLK